MIEAPSSPTSQCSLPSYLFEHVNMIGTSSISLFGHPLDFGSMHVMNQDSVDFAFLPHLDLTTHDGFSFPSIQAIPDDDEMDKEAYWPYLDHQLEEGSHMLLEEIIEINLGDK